jgi:hypothetical protein
VDTDGYFLERDHHLADSNCNAFRRNALVATIACPKPDAFVITRLMLALSFREQATIIPKLLFSQLTL